MALKLPEDQKKPRKVRVAPPQVQSDALAPEDSIEYSLTLEVSRDKGHKAWIKFGTTSAVRDGETTEQARKRVTEFVEEELDRRLEELGD
jgi:hypothetical protein